MRTYPIYVYVLALGLTLFAACGDEDATTTQQPSISAPGASGGAGFGPGLSVAEARKSRLDGPLLVNGYVLSDGAKVRLCDTLASSSSAANPPQCGGASLEVHGLDLATLPGVTSSGPARWSSQPRQLLGEVKNGVLTVSGTSH